MIASIWRLRSVILLLVFSVSQQVVGQSVTISGYVEESTSSERILGASVSIPEMGSGTTTNQYGFYSLTTSVGPVRLLISHVGYEPATRRLELTRDTTLTITLDPKIVRLNDLEVNADRESSLEEVQMSRHEITMEEIETLPVILGEIDIQKTLQLLPSVQSGIEGSSGLYIRGGRADQNLILLDGLPLYNPNHLFGFFSVFHSSSMKQVELIKGGFPARYGGRLSSVVNYTMKEGNLKRFEGEAAVGLISSRLRLEGPIVKDRTSFLIAGRRTYFDQLSRPFQFGRERFGASFYDLNVKANHILSKKDRIYLSGYLGKDQFHYHWFPVPGGDDVDKYHLNWKNRMASFRWNRVMSDRLFANVLMGVTQYRFSSKIEHIESTQEEFIEFDQSWYSEILDWTTKIDVEFIPNSMHYVRFGFEGIRHRFSPGTTQVRLDNSDRQPINLLQTPTGILLSRQLAVYVEDEMQLHRSLRVTTGIRLTDYKSRNSQSRSFEPRFGISLRIGDRTALKASYAKSKQYVHLLSGGGAAFPTDLWIPSMAGITPQKGDQVALGLVQTYQDGEFEISVEGYFKRMNGLLEYKVGADRFRSAFLDWPDVIEVGRGTSYGAEFFLKKNSGALTGWAGYTWARTTRQFEFLNDGQSFSDGYDRRHDISAVLQYYLSGTKQISAVWVYGSGYPIWVPVGRYVSSGGFGTESDYYYPLDLLETGPVNTARAPSYHRLDLSMHFYKKKSWGERTISIGLYNVYNRKNPMFVYLKGEAGGTGDSIISFHQLSLLQLIPAISWQYRF